MTQQDTPQGGTMPIMAHLDELRKRLLRYMVVLVICVLCAYAFRKEILDFIRKPVEGPLNKYTSGQLLEASPTEERRSSSALSSLNQYDCECQEKVVIKASPLAEAEDATLNSTQTARAPPSFVDRSVDLNSLEKRGKPFENGSKIDVLSEIEGTTDIKLSTSDPGKTKEFDTNLDEEGKGVIATISDSVIDFVVFFQVLMGKDPTAIKGYSDQSEWTPETPEIEPVFQGNPDVLNLQCTCSLKTEAKAHTGSSMVFIGLPELFFAQMKIALYAGFFFSLPFLFIQIWRFVGPALFKDEKTFFWLFVFSAYVCFIGGALFGYLIVFPYGFDFFLSLSQPGEIMPSISIGGYLSFAMKMLLAFGTIFELPVLVFILSRMGILTPKIMIKQARVAILAVFILSAILTPPDPFTMSLMAGPLIILYFISVGVCFLGVDRKKAAMRQQGINPSDMEL